mgnify:CR=1 FL=1
MTGTYSVPGMSCGHCVEAITGEVGKVEGVSDVRIDLDTKIVTVVGGGRDAIAAARRWCSHPCECEQHNSTISTSRASDSHPS